MIIDVAPIFGHLPSPPLPWLFPIRMDLACVNLILNVFILPFVTLTSAALLALERDVIYMPKFWPGLLREAV